MTIAQAKKALSQVKKIEHLYFMPGEYVHLVDGEIHDEKGFNINSTFWKYRKAKIWDLNWSLYNFRLYGEA